jgi:hypothetical protein
MQRFILFLFIVGTSSASAQVPLGSKTPYIAPTNAPLPPPPGYAPYFINHVGRHGARHVTNLKELTTLSTLLDSSNLTPDGQRLRKMVRALLTVERQYTPGTLSQTGLDEQYNLGRRMALRLPTEPGACVSVVTTREERTLQSANSFLKGLGDGDSLPCLIRQGIDSVHLRFFSLSPAYKTFEKKGPWTAALDRLRAAPATTAVQDAILRRLFIRDYPDPETFCAALYAAAAITAGLSTEINASGFRPEDVDIFSLLRPGEADRLALLDGAKDFLVKGPGFDAGGIQVRDAVPLLVDFLQTAADRLGAGKPGATLRFAHAETMAPIAALMDLEGVSTPDTALAHYTDVWTADRAMVYSGNIQWLFFRKPGSGDLVEILFNERPVHIPVAATAFPFYRWQDVQHYYLDKLRRLGVDPAQDMYQYLLNLR